MTDLRKAAEMALEALELLDRNGGLGLEVHEYLRTKIQALRQALAQPEQKKEWIGLTDKELKEIVCATKKPIPEDLKFMEDAVVKELTPLAKSIEIKLKEKNT